MTTLASLAAAFVLTSPAFAPGHAIPVRYTCDGPDVSPPLRWTTPPPGTRSLALRLVDLDSRPRPFLHWHVTGIPPSLRGLPADAHVGRVQGNDFSRAGYTGPCPVPGEKHRYRFQLVAVAANGRLLARATLVAPYRRR
jgi:Raf kinase inhibitor-like YbhB/YbcL family protein